MLGGYDWQVQHTALVQSFQIQATIQRVPYTYILRRRKWTIQERHSDTTPFPVTSPGIVAILILVTSWVGSIVVDLPTPFGAAVACAIFPAAVRVESCAAVTAIVEDAVTQAVMVVIVVISKEDEGCDLLTHRGVQPASGSPQRIELWQRETQGHGAG